MPRFKISYRTAICGDGDHTKVRDSEWQYDWCLREGTSEREVRRNFYAEFGDGLACQIIGVKNAY